MAKTGSLQPIQQFAYTKGKNATDSSLIIDAMDLLYACNLDGFCIVSSDSDFTRLASRLKEAGKRVYGFGEKKTPRPFVAACDRFIYTEIFTSAEGQAPRRQPARIVVSRTRSAPQTASRSSGFARIRPRIFSISGVYHRMCCAKSSAYGVVPQSRTHSVNNEFTVRG